MIVIDRHGRRVPLSPPGSKTLIATDAALELVQRGEATACYLNMEMDREQMIERIARSLPKTKPWASEWPFKNRKKR